jgi:hypothetical protein
MSLIIPGQPQPNTHVCNAYCLDDLHAQVFYRRANEAPRREAREGDRVLLYGRWARIVSVQPAPEAPDPVKFKATRKLLWFFRWDGP